MVCCCIPCFKRMQKKFDPVPGSGPFTLAVTETIRWIMIVIPLYLSVWRYAELTECYSFDLSICPHNGTDGVYPPDREPDIPLFWGYVTAIIMGGSVFLYWPIKMCALRWRMQHNRFKDYRWRPSILTYMIICALPCIIIIGYAAVDERNESDTSTLDEITTTVLQVMILGLTVTEWMAKVREEHLTFDLITAMAVDFFFAYDVIQFIMLPTYESDIFHSEWLYVCFVMAFVAMFKYIPAQPTNIIQEGAPKGAAITILVSMFCVDIPFVIVRLWTMFEFGLIVSDLIHPVKNIALICFGCTQLWIIYVNHKAMEKRKRAKEAEEERQRMVVVGESRQAKFPVCVWSKEHGAMICTWEVESEVPRVTRDKDLRASWTADLSKDNNAFEMVPPADYDDELPKKRKCKGSQKKNGSANDVTITDVDVD